MNYLHFFLANVVVARDLILDLDEPLYDSKAKPAAVTSISVTCGVRCPAICAQPDAKTLPLMSDVRKWIGACVGDKEFPADYTSGMISVGFSLDGTSDTATVCDTKDCLAFSTTDLWGGSLDDKEAIKFDGVTFTKATCSSPTGKFYEPSDVACSPAGDAVKEISLALTAKADGLVPVTEANRTIGRGGLFVVNVTSCAPTVASGNKNILKASVTYPLIPSAAPAGVGRTFAFSSLFALAAFLIGSGF